jgi:branched-chain amino acid transport system ATP-binding protein
MTPRLEVSDLAVRYGQALAVRGVSLAVAEGETLAVVGANGGGKSSLGKAVARLAPSTGAVLLDGAPVPPRAVDAVGAGIVYVPEGRMVFTQLSVADNLRAGAFSARRRDWEARRATLYERLPRLAERASVRAGMLSGGEQQLLAIGRALMAFPSVLVLDEPSLGLSPSAVVTVTDFLREIQREYAMTVLLLEQNTAFAARLADRTLVLELGVLRDEPATAGRTET